MRQHSALILEPERDSRGVQCSAFNVRTVVPYLEYYHRIPIHYGNGVTSGTSILNMESINIWYPTDQNARNFLVKFLVNFKRKCVEISIIYECNLKIVKKCEECANFESGLLSEKLLRIEKVAQNVQVARKVPSRICQGLELNLTETLFFFRLSFTLSVSNIHNPNSTPRQPATPYLRTRTSRETQSLVSLDARRFSS